MLSLPRSRKWRVRFLLLSLAALLLAAPSPPTLAAADAPDSGLAVGSCSDNPAMAAPPRRDEVAEPEKPSGLTVTTPNRIELDVDASVTQRCRLEVYNDSDKSIDVSLSATNLGPASSPRSIAAKTEESEFGAGSWITFEKPDFRLAPFERMRFDVIIEPPTEAPIGTNLAGISVEQTGAAGAVGTKDYSGVVRIEALVQAYFTIPGPVEHELRVKSIKLRDKFAFGGARFAVWEILFSNDGTVNEHVTGTVTIRSLFGTSAERYKIDDLLVLRGATRSYRIVWPDVPWVGAFHPELRVRGDDAKVIEETGPRILVVPWWIIALIMASLILPFVISWWRRRLAWEDFVDEHEHPSEQAQYPEWDAGDDDLDEDLEPDGR